MNQKLLGRFCGEEQAKKNDVKNEKYLKVRDGI